VAVLGQAVQRAAAAKYPSRSGTALKRRAVVGVLVLLSVILITVYFRESPNGGLHGVQGVGATILRPFQVGIERVVRPFRDMYGYFDGLVAAKGENERLRAEVEQLRHQVIQNGAAFQENRRLRELLGYRAPAAYPADYRPLHAAVVSHASQFEQQIVIAAGSDDGVRLNDPVVNPDGLVGRVTAVAPRTAQVTLLTDDTSAVSAQDLRTGASGIVRHGRTGGTSLILDFVQKKYVVARGDVIVTAGSTRGELASLYPRGIPIGKVTFEGQSDTDLYKRIQVEPFVDFDSLDSVIVLAPSPEAAATR